MDSIKYVFNISAVSYKEVEVDIAAIAASPQTYYSAGDLAWMMVSSALVLLMVLGISLFYSGVSSPRIALSNTWLPLMTAAVVGVQWYLFGYAIAFSNWPNSTTFWGGVDGIGLNNALLRPVPGARNSPPDGPCIPEIQYVLFEGMFASFTAALVAGDAAWKVRPGHFLVFILFWTTFVYDPIARWTWNPDGWSNKWGSLDFAGGSAVHICAAATVLAHCIFHKFILPPMESLMERPRATQQMSPIPSDQLGNGGPPASAPGTGIPVPVPTTTTQASEESEFTDYTNVCVGTLLLWIGWFGFNGGSALGANIRAVSACVATHVAACTGAVVHCLLTASWEFWMPSESEDEEADNTKARVFRFSIMDFCNGAIIGLVAITPAAGYVPHTVAPVFGVVPTVLCWALTDLSTLINDTQFIVVIHGIGGFVGMLLTGVFARGSVAALDGATNPTSQSGGWDGHWMQILTQLADATAATAYAFAMTMLILVVLEPFMFLSRRRRPRNTKGRLGKARIVEDKDVIVEG